MTKKLSIGFIGTRGIPNEYGGYEAAVQELAPRLALRGHKVVVYCSSLQNYSKTTWKGVHLKFSYDPENKIGSSGQFIYDLLSNLKARKEDHDVIFHMGYTSDSVWYRFWDKRALHITNMDGMEWKRSKYSPKVRSFLKKAEKLAAIKSNLLIADSDGIMDYLKFRYETPVLKIAYGVSLPDIFVKSDLADYNLVPFGYDLIIARMVPENNIEMAIEAKINSQNDIPLIIFGNENAFWDKLSIKYKNINRIIFYKANYNKNVLDSIRHFSRYYIHGHSVGGTNPSLLEAMATGCRILAHDNVFNNGVLLQGGAYFDSTKSLSKLFNQNSDTLISKEQIR